jgi:hypothetical protein
MANHSFFRGQPLVSDETRRTTLPPEPSFTMDLRDFDPPAWS